MSELALSGPSADGPKQLEYDADHPGGDRAEAPPGAAGQEDPRPTRKVPSTRECLEGLAQLPGLVALNLLKPAQANSIRGVYREILQHHEKCESRETHARQTNVDVLEAARKDPHLFNLLEPFLSDEQVAMVMQDAREGDGGET
jgi:hypothetical protein